MAKKAKPSIEQAVLAKIRDGDVVMRPKAFFVISTIFGAVAASLGGLVLAYVFSIVFFSLKIATADTPAYGARSRLSEVAASFPWWALIAAFIFVALGWQLLKKDRRVYRIRRSVLVTVFVLVSLLAGVVLYSAGIASPDGGFDRPTDRPWRGQMQKMK